jgi:hypothetical protein
MNLNWLRKSFKIFSMAIDISAEAIYTNFSISLVLIVWKSQASVKSGVPYRKWEL